MNQDLFSNISKICDTVFGLRKIILKRSTIHIAAVFCLNFDFFSNLIWDTVFTFNQAIEINPKDNKTLET